MVVEEKKKKQFPKDHYIFKILFFGGKTRPYVELFLVYNIVLTETERLETAPLLQAKWKEKK